MKWDDGLLDTLMAMGLMREGKRAEGLYLEECLAQAWAEPIIWRPNGKGRITGVFCCMEPDCAGAHIIEPERMRAWELDWDGLCCAVASAAKAGGPMHTDAESRVTMLGAITRGGLTRELFLVRGLSRRDGPGVFASAARLNASPNATVLFCGEMPEPQQRRPNWKTVLVLSEIITLHRGKLALPLHRLFEDQTLPAAPAGTAEAASGTLTQTELEVLQALAEGGDEPQLVVQLVAASGHKRDAVMQATRRLISMGLAERPGTSRRKGIAATQQGLRRVGKLPKMA